MKIKNKRIVLDVNVWISIFLAGDFRFVRSFVARGAVILRSQKLENELEEVLGYEKFHWQKPRK